MLAFAPVDAMVTTPLARHHERPEISTRTRGRLALPGGVDGDRGSVTDSKSHHYCYH